MKTQKPIIVTTALTYANGPLHLGHLVEHIQADIWIRFKRLQGQACIFLSGDDAHGTPIMIAAKKQGISPEELVDAYQKNHLEDLQQYGIQYDYYGSTHSQTNQKLTYQIYEVAKTRGDITTDRIEQAYDEQEKVFLPDRLIKGSCPKCTAPDQYGDSCEQCGAFYAATELVDPVSTLSNTPPSRKSSEHYFFDIARHAEFLDQWMKKCDLNPSVRNKLQEWFTDGLRAWDISRDAPYFGFKIPNTTDKYFYVWLDAPIGYFAGLHDYCADHGYTFSDFIHPNNDTQLIHFIGKDIITFHALFWPALLHSAQFKTPTAIFTHGFLTINGQKMSKSRGTFITAKALSDVVNPEYLRYYYAAKLGNGLEDIDLNGEDFVSRINSDVVGKLVNIASRLAKFLSKYFDNQLSNKLHDPQLITHLVDRRHAIAEQYESRNLQQAIRHIMELADQVNQYIDQHKPWQIAKDPSQLAEVQAICTTGINAFRLLILYLKPVLPKLCERAEHFLNHTINHWDDAQQPLLNHTVNEFEPLAQRIDQSTIHSLLNHE